MTKWYLDKSPKWDSQILVVMHLDGRFINQVGEYHCLSDSYLPR